MKAKYLLVTIGFLLTICSLWVARAAWRVHRQLVSLNVYNAPLADVLRQIEKQTWKKIHAEKALDARITLRVTDKPLPAVLNRIAQQAGARWSTIFAVYGSSHALSALESALRTDGQLEPAGWTKIAPNAEDFTPGGMGNPAEHLRINPRPDDPGPGESGSTSGALALSALPENLPLPEMGAPGEGRQRRVVAESTAGGQVMFFGGPTGQMEMWSPEQLVLESALKPRLRDDTDQTPTAQAAAQTAAEVKGRWTTLIAFHKSNMGIGFGGLPPSPGGPGRRGQGPAPGDQNQRFVTLTPSQRVQRARERVQWRQEQQVLP